MAKHTNTKASTKASTKANTTANTTANTNTNTNTNTTANTNTNTNTNTTHPLLAALGTNGTPAVGVAMVAKGRTVWLHAVGAGNVVAPRAFAAYSVGTGKAGAHLPTSLNLTQGPYALAANAQGATSASPMGQAVLLAVWASGMGTRAAQPNCGPNGAAPYCRVWGALASVLASVPAYAGLPGTLATPLPPGTLANLPA